MTKEKLSIVAIDALIPYINNSRTHSAEQVNQLAASIKEFGFVNPVLVDGDHGIIAGHGRVMAAKKLGLKEVPVLEVTHLSPAQKKAYIIADNQLALIAGWDMDLLKVELEALGEMDFDIDLLGFDADFLADLTAPEPTDGLTDEDEVPEAPEEPISKPGDVWILGNHRLMCGDSTSIDDVERLMNGKKAALLHADPPYGMGKEGDGVANDNLYGDKLDKFQMEWWATFRTFLDDNASAYIWGNAPELWRLWYRGGLGDSERLTLRNEITWDKKSGQGMGSEDFRMYPTATERCLFFMLGEQGFNNNADNYWDGWEPIRAYLEGEMKRLGWTLKDLNEITGTQMANHWVTKSQWSLITADHYAKIQQATGKHEAFKRDHEELKRDHEELKREFYSTRAYFDNTHDSMTDVWDFKRVTGEDRHGHATPKPVEMMERIMRSSIPKKFICIEPFGGSGSTLMGAEKTGRFCYTMELKQQYCDVIINRWQNFTGKQAILESTGQTYAELKAEK